MQGSYNFKDSADAVLKRSATPFPLADTSTVFSNRDVIVDAANVAKDDMYYPYCRRINRTTFTADYYLKIFPEVRRVGMEIFFSNTVGRTPLTDPLLKIGFLTDGAMTALQNSISLDDFVFHLELKPGERYVMPDPVWKGNVVLALGQYAGSNLGCTIRVLDKMARPSADYSLVVATADE